MHLTFLQTCNIIYHVIVFFQIENRRNRRMKKLLYTLSGSFIIFAAVFAVQDPLTAAEKKKRTRPVTIYTQSEFKLSQERMNFIDGVLDNAIKRNLDLTRDSTILLLETEIAGKMPLTPKAAVSNKSISQFATEARKMVRDNATYTAELTNLRTNAEKEAANKYPLAKPRTKVKFQYQKGPYIENVDGTFYAAFDRYVQIDGKRIPYVDLPPELRAMFDRKFNAEKRKEFVDGKIRELEQQKEEEIQKTFTDLLAGQDILNEKNGYIYDKSAKQWVSAKDYLQSKLPDALKKYQEYLKEKQEKERLANEREAARLKEQQGVQAATGVDTSNQEKYKKILEEAKEKRKKIHQEFSGVDAYQGFRNALWGATREEVAFLFSRISGARIERIDFDSKLILPRYFPAEVFFKFDQNQLVMVTLYYGYANQIKNSNDQTAKTEIQRLFTSDDFDRLIVTLHDICGLSEEEKLFVNQNIFREIAKGKLTPEDLLPPKDEKSEKNAETAQDVKENESMKKEPEKVFTFHWIGQKTDMTLTFIYNNDNKIYQDVQLTKKQKEK